MLAYWIAFLLPAFAAIQEQRRKLGAMQNPVYVTIIGVLLAIMIGFRYRVGADWDIYLLFLDVGRVSSLGDVLLGSDPGYLLANWITALTVDKIWFVNLICAIIFSYGMILFAKNQPRPYLALAVAIPYLVIVVAMGYSRQSVAIGLTMVAWVALVRDHSLAKFLFWVILATTFHKTALLLTPIVALSTDRGRLWTMTWVGIATFLLYITFLQQNLGSFFENYIQAKYQSEGAAIRVAMNALPAFIFLLARRRFALSNFELRLWTTLSLLAALCLVWLALSPSSTAVDRMALYLIPLQIFVLSRIPDAFPKFSQEIVQYIVVAVIAYSAIVLFVWLNFATYSDQWIPYRLYPIFSNEQY